MGLSEEDTREEVVKKARLSFSESTQSSTSRDHINEQKHVKLGESLVAHCKEEIARAEGGRGCA